MKSVSASIEAKILEALRALELPFGVVGFLETAAQGEVKEEDLTSAQVRVWNLAQSNEAQGFFSLSAEIRITVEQAESANGDVFYAGHEKIARWLERMMLRDACDELSTESARVNGLERTGDDKDFDTVLGAWFAVWQLTLKGTIKQEEATNG